MQGSKAELRWWSYLITALAIYGLWHVVSVILDSIALPTPLTVLFAFIAGLKADLISHSLISTLRIGYGIALAFSLAVPIGLLSYERRVDKFVAPLIYMLYPIPHIVLLPVIILLFGIGDLSKIIMIALIVFFQILVTTRDASRNISGNYIYPMLSLGASKKEIYKHVILPASFPKILTAMRISVGTAIAVLFFVESFATTRGLGYLIMDAWSRADYPDLYAAIVTMGLLGFGVYILIDRVEKKVCKWVYL
jgi:ABC-type nitrate/sulfonate/bicarbonate transport system permease component